MNGKAFFFQDTYLWVDKLLLRNSIFRRNEDQTWKRLPPNSAYEVDVELALAFIRQGQCRQIYYLLKKIDGIHSAGPYE